MADRGAAGSSLTARAWRRSGRRLPWSRREAVASAAALAALFTATACGSDDGSAGSTTTTAAPTSLVTTSTLGPTTSAPATTAPSPTTTAPPRSSTTRASATTRSTTTIGAGCITKPDGSQSCSIPGRPLRRRLGRRRGAGFLLPVAGGDGGPGDEARAEYASVASFGELALRLLAVGAPPDLVAACHEAALDEIRHASVCAAQAGRPGASFGALPELLGRRLGGRRRSRTLQLQRLAVESLLDGWVNEGAAAAELRARASRAASPEDRAAYRSMAADEQRHADLARAIVTWCFDEEPAAVGRALASAA